MGLQHRAHDLEAHAGAAGLAPCGEERLEDAVAIAC
jgi:hypothetical protein